MLKCTVFYTLGNGGWSETWYRDGSTLSAGFGEIQILNQLRMAMNVATVGSSYYRISLVENPAVFLVQPSGLVGTASGTRDLLNAAILWRCQTAQFNRRQIITRGIDDGIIVGGNYTPSSAFAVAAANWASRLASAGWCLRTKERTSNPLVDIAGISTTGLVTTFASQPWVVGNTLQFFRLRDTLGKTVKGQFKIVSTASDTTFQITPWTAGRITGPGRVRRIVYIADPVAGIFVNRPFTRKTGRPFGSPVGRRRVVR